MPHVLAQTCYPGPQEAINRHPEETQQDECSARLTLAFQGSSTLPVLTSHKLGWNGKKTAWVVADSTLGPNPLLPSLWAWLPYFGSFCLYHLVCWWRCSWWRQIVSYSTFKQRLTASRFSVHCIHKYNQCKDTNEKTRVRRNACQVGQRKLS